MPGDFPRKIIRRPSENHRKTIENHRKIIGTPWENHKNIAIGKFP
jgi:hypothetical protein